MCKKYCKILIASLGLAFSLSSHAFGELENTTLVVYTQLTGAPQSFVDKDLRNPKGIDIDILRELQRRLLFTISENRIFPLERNEAFERLRTGRADLVIGGISATPERREFLDFTHIFYSSSLGVLYNHKNNNFKQIADIKGKKIGVSPGSTSEMYAEQNGAIPVAVHNNTLAMFDVAYGKLDGFIYDRPPIANFAQTMNSLNLGVNTQEFGHQECQFAFALSKDSPYTKIINQTLDDMMEDGTLQAILEKWDAQ